MANSGSLGAAVVSSFRFGSSEEFVGSMGCGSEQATIPQSAIVIRICSKGFFKVGKGNQSFQSYLFNLISRVTITNTMFFALIHLSLSTEHYSRHS